MQKWRVIYPQGDRTRLDIALVFYYEEDDWDLASHREFPYEQENECREYMVELAKRNNLNHSGKDNSAYLD
jgi:hypothetical protein